MRISIDWPKWIARKKRERMKKVATSLTFFLIFESFHPFDSKNVFVLAHRDIDTFINNSENAEIHYRKCHILKVIKADLLLMIADLFKNFASSFFFLLL